MSSDYCELCDLPLSTCVHGMPPAPKEVPAPPVTTTRAPRATRAAAPRSASATPRKSAPKAAAANAVPVRRFTPRFTTPDTFVPHIFAVLQEAGGSLATDDFFDALEPRVEEFLVPGDRESTPEGELRWRRASRRARRDLTTAGLILAGTPGVWQLTEAGLEYDPAYWGVVED